MRALFLAAVALVFIFLDQTNLRFHAYCEKAAMTTYPLRMLVSKPIMWSKQAVESITLQRHLIEENEQLQAREIFLQLQVHQLLQFQRENKQLKSLLNAAANISGRVIMAQLLAVSLDPSLHQIIVDKGDDNHVYSGQPVFDAFGVVGQVIEVTTNASRVLLLTDSRSAIPVENNRTGLRAIVRGMGIPYHLDVANVPILTDVKKGDLFVTSGYGGHFPPGYPIGVVDHVDKNANKTFLDITVTPLAHLDDMQRVLLVWPAQLKLHDQVQQLLSKPLPTLSE